MTASTRADTPDEPTSWLAGIPAWARWSGMTALGILLLTIVQGISGTERLTDAGTASAMLRWSIPILLAGLGGLFAERAGVVNIGLEGMMILGTWCSAWGAINWGPWGGLAAGIIGGALGGLLHAVVTVQFGVDQIISGVAINILAPAFARFMSERVFSGEAGGSISQSPRVDGLADVSIPFLAGGKIGDWTSPDLFGRIADADIPWISDIGSVLKGLTTGMSLMTLLALACIPLTAVVLMRTRFGLRLRSAGENPTAGESLGVNIYLHKYLGVMISGGLAGMAGAYIVLELTGIYRGGQTTGRGFIGLAALIFGNWKPMGVLLGALLFGYPFGLSLVDFESSAGGGTTSGVATRSVLLVVAIALVGVAVWSRNAGRKVDTAIALALSFGCLLWYLLTDAAPAWLPGTMPYVLVLVVLVFGAQKLRPPAAAGKPFRRGDH